VTDDNGRLEMLDRALESVITQTFRDFEVYVVDDGSASPHREELLGVLKAWEKRFLAVGIDMMWHQLPYNTGSQSTPLNFISQFARGDLLAPLDGDDEFTPDHLQTLVDVIFEDPQTSMAYGTHRLVKGEPIPPEYESNLPKDAEGNPYREQIAFDPTRVQRGPKWGFIGTCDMLYSRNSAFAEVERGTGMLWRDGHHAFNDWDFVARWTMNGLVAVGVNKVISIAHFHDDNFTTHSSQRNRQKVGVRRAKGVEAWRLVRSSCSRQIQRVSI
jgi:glycosyltransferase involved in cell wall biosynthesis